MLIHNLIRLMRAKSDRPDLGPAQAITELVKHGVPTGTAQRLLDPAADSRLASIELAADKLGVTVSALLVQP